MKPIFLREMSIPAAGRSLESVLRIPTAPRGVVLFAHGSGSSRLSPRNTYVAERLGDADLATLLFDLLTPEEELVDSRTGELRFDIPFLANRLAAVTTWVQRQPSLKRLRVGLFGASTGAAAALVTAAQHPEVGAVVSRGGRPDLADAFLAEVRAPTLLIVGGEDTEVLALNRTALAQLTCEAKLEVVPGATHLFVEPGSLERVASLAAAWFTRFLNAPTPN